MSDSEKAKKQATLNWRRISTVIRELEALPANERKSRLKAIQNTMPQDGDEITEYFERQDVLSSFMQTSAPGHAEEQNSRAFAKLKPGDVVDNWRIEERIGAGGMGAVYRAARDDGLYEHKVALKIINSGSLEQKKRFELERQRLAQIDHPGVSRIIDGGVTDTGLPYMVMEFVNGTPIDIYIDQHEASNSELLTLFENLCLAVGHAHGRLIIHRDIKPANVLVDSDGNIKLIDFGVASFVEGDEFQSTGPLTISYAAPEQLQRGMSSIATDIFSLGVLLYSLLTGAQVSRQSDGSITFDSNLVYDKDLAAIIEKATAFEQNDRYASAAALAADVAAARDLRPVAARAGGRLYKNAKFVQRHPVSSILSSLLVVAVVVGLGVSLVFLDRAEREAARANSELTRAEFLLSEVKQANSISQTYVDLFDRVLTNDGESEKIKEAMLERAAEAYEFREQQPETAAEISLVVGEHFIFEYDIPAALSVLEPWVQANFGSNRLVRAGKLQLAIAYSRLGEFERATALFNELEKEFSDPLEQMSIRRLEWISERAIATRDPDHVRQAQTAIRQSVEQSGSDDPDKLLVSLFMLQEFSKQLGDFEGAYRTSVRAANLYDDNPLMDMHGWISVHLHVAGFELYHKKNYSAAEQLLDEVIAWSKNNGSPDDNAYRMKAAALIAQNRFDEAEALIAVARTLESQSFGSDVYSRAVYVELLTSRGDLEEAEQELNQLLTEADPDNAKLDIHPRFVLAAAYLAAVKDGPDAARSLLESYGLSHERLTSSHVWKFRLDRLNALGVVAPNTPSAQ